VSVQAGAVVHALQAAELGLRVLLGLGMEFRDRIDTHAHAAMASTGTSRPEYSPICISPEPFCGNSNRFASVVSVPRREQSW
jgi:hypothetical protein